MATVRNVLFIMCDQLRADHLSCMGHAHLATPHIDALAARGVRFMRAYCAAPTCGPSRMSFYTGRSMFSHGAIWNFVPLSLREQLIGDYLSPAGIDVALVGKTHFAADEASMRRLGIVPEGPLGTWLRDGAFHPVSHYEGHANPGGAHPYSVYLREQGYDGDPWEDHVMSALDPSGRIVSGWHMRNVHLPARVAEAHSETAYTTDCAIDYVRRRGDRPWFLHLSYIKPHWPYLAPAPYHAMYGREDCLAIVKGDAERTRPHPVAAAYQRHCESVTFARDEVAYHVRPAYMGLVKQIDDHLGRLFAVLEELGRFDDTLVVFTSDHGDYLGDHWLGDKDLFHEPSARIPLIVYDPDGAADGRRGAALDALVEGSDVLASVLDALALPRAEHLIEGHSLVPLLRGGVEGVRDIAVTEVSYAFREARRHLGQEKARCRGYMLRSERWKYIYWEGFAAQLFDLTDDPDELVDRGTDAAFASVRAEHAERLFEWVRARKLAVTLPDEAIVIARDEIEPLHGIRIGIW